MFLAKIKKRKEPYVFVIYVLFTLHDKILGIINGIYDRREIQKRPPEIDNHSDVKNRC